MSWSTWCVTAEPSLAGLKAASPSLPPSSESPAAQCIPILAADSWPLRADDADPIIRGVSFSLLTLLMIPLLTPLTMSVSGIGNAAVSMPGKLFAFWLLSQLDA